MAHKKGSRPRRLPVVAPSVSSLAVSLVVLGWVSVFCNSVRAQTWSPAANDFVMHDFRFESGEVLPDLRLHYVTIGALKRDTTGHVTNAVLLLHGTTSNGKDIITAFSNQLFGNEQPLDVSKYFLVIPDAIGHGGSSKPSDGLRANFPHYGYVDMVEAQHRLVVEGLGIDHLRLVLGTSMGGMHTWLWAEKYPDMMDALMPLTSQPTQIAGHNLLWRRVLTEAIRTDPDWDGGNYVKQPSHWLAVFPLFSMMVSSRAGLFAMAPTRAKAIAAYDRMVEYARQTYDANDFLYAFESSHDYDPQPDIGRIKAELTAVNFADDMINAAELGIVEQAVAKIPHARSVAIPADGRSFGHLAQNHPELWKDELVKLLASTP